MDMTIGSTLQNFSRRWTAVRVWHVSKNVVLPPTIGPSHEASALVPPHIDLRAEGYRSCDVVFVHNKMSQGRGKRGAAEHSSRDATPSEKVDRPTPESSAPHQKESVDAQAGQTDGLYNDSPGRVYFYWGWQAPDSRSLAIP